MVEEFVYSLPYLEKQGWKTYTTSTLRSMKKDDLIRLIRNLEHNWNGAEEKCERQYLLLVQNETMDVK